MMNAALAGGNSMNGDHYRYFVVLQPGDRHALSPLLQRQARRTMALEFAAMLKEWIAENGLQAEVSAIDVTLFGQVLITCDPDFIDHIRGQDMLAINEIRPAQPVGQQLRKLLDEVSG